MDLGLSVATYFVLVLVLLYFLNQWNGKNPANYPPGPKCWPLIGNLHILNLRRLHLTYIELAKIYGSVFSVQMGMRKIVVLAGYDTVKDALLNHAEEFGERAKLKIFKDMDKGLGLTLSNGENWKVMRRFTITTLRDFGMGRSTIEDKVVEESTHLIDHIASFKDPNYKRDRSGICPHAKWNISLVSISESEMDLRYSVRGCLPKHIPCRTKKKAPIRKQFDDLTILNAAVANIIVTILLGHRMNYEDPQFRRLLSLINENVRLLAAPMVSLYNIYPILGFLPGSHKTILKNVDELRGFITQTFVKHLKDLDENDQRSFIDAFLVRQKEETENPQTHFHDDNLRILVRNLFTAGMETTSTTLSWGLLLMVKYPEIQEKVQEEISRVVGSAQPLYSHRGQMPFTHAVVHEIQRQSDILPLSLTHETSTDVTFKGYFIPKGTYIIPLLTSVLKDKTQFEKPDEFYPNHFLDAKGNFVKKDAFMPFSAGRRACAGENLARMELFIFFTSLLQKFTFCVPPGASHVDLTPGFGFTNAPRKQMICAVPRF